MHQFREMRRRRQQLSTEEAVAILQKSTAGTLALLGDNDYPYAVPLSYVYQDGRIYFHSALAGHKVDAVRKNEKASFCVIEQDDVQPKKYTTFYRSVIAFGRVHVVDDAAEKMRMARMLGNRYNPNDDVALSRELESGLSRMLMIRLDIEHLTGKQAIELLSKGPAAKAESSLS
ncbi:MAG: pyridoxamine 5'-phosphate oxidase family protein [Bacteroidaceae bacterium]|nr:pyridoxamine 5'-phosphate oxidase family protein [Bacteroidaceae bacterium]MBR3633624.1 pyridoxamine 5'-phosphate oxidase family protein [Bacteroidaceae bacterium]MBR3732937.1 pyridoxamine 5'-phosphate oxidase family protein [Bacteroidaceae bacterium]MBR4649112.1 pyridoxamine 5'-phosphate oxidase family protein [Bacteroidaceae bacterium]MBR6714176.1 pyridoxamine 5'-phosphate oxidase family protein [Bacteroidaceae bacterium]